MKWWLNADCRWNGRGLGDPVGHKLIVEQWPHRHHRNVGHNSVISPPSGLMLVVFISRRARDIRWWFGRIAFLLRVWPCNTHLVGGRMLVDPRYDQIRAGFFFAVKSLSFSFSIITNELSLKIMVQKNYNTKTSHRDKARPNWSSSSPCNTWHGRKYFITTKTFYSQSAPSASNGSSYSKRMKWDDRYVSICSNLTTILLPYAIKMEESEPRNGAKTFKMKFITTRVTSYSHG